VMTAAIVIGAWALGSLLLGLFLGACLAAEKRKSLRNKRLDV
jgi:hypothetical protein